MSDLLFSIGWTEKSEVIKTPIGYNDPPKKFYCLECGSVNKSVYKQTTRYFEFLFCKCSSGEKSKPFLACDRCNFKIVGLELKKCKYCKVSANSNTKFCMICGKERDI